MKYLRDYTAPPADDRWRPITVEELALVQISMRDCKTYACDDARDADMSAVHAAIVAAGFGEQVMMAEDEDGLYFAAADAVAKLEVG